MEKPISMRIHETKKSLIQTCNESQLPLCILEMILKDIYNETYALSEVQRKKEETIYLQDKNSQSKESTEQN